MLQHPWHPDLANADGRSSLMLASRSGHTEIVQLLLEARADKDFTDNRGITGLMLACQQGHVEVVSLLLESGANKALADTAFGCNALIRAWAC